ncbi:MAG: hypothetical protein RBT40_02085 [Petrimonas sp.]|jgi:hypothetical protein|nr:hypothetical protein [Petrimonas sp.]
MEKRKWLVINYNLPTEPSRHRVSTWRNLRKLGALNIQQSMWVLVDNEENHSALQDLSQYIESNQGEVLLMESVFFAAKHEEKVISLFTSMRNEEYTEYIHECDKYFKELEKEISIEKYTFAELEEEEEELQKLISWYQKIKARDVFNASEGNTAKERTEQIKKAFEDYSEAVYKHNE